MKGTTTNQSHTGLSAESVSLQIAEVLWHVFGQRVEPLVRIMYRWAWEELRTKSIDPELRLSISATENALLTAIYYVSANSLTDEESITLLQQSRSSFLDERQARCEDALLSTNIFCMTDLGVIKAVVFYSVRKPYALPRREADQDRWQASIGLALRAFGRSWA
jgi:hypothetical protein